MGPVAFVSQPFTDGYRLTSFVVIAVSSQQAVDCSPKGVRLPTQLFAVASGLGPVATRLHVAPSALPVPRSVVEDARTPRIGAFTNPNQLARDEPIRRRLDDRDHEAREHTARRHEVPHESAVRPWLHAPRARAAPENAVDLDDRGLRRALVWRVAALGEGAQHVAQAARLVERGARAGRLLQRAAG